jgi:hypothetical protein
MSWVVTSGHTPTNPQKCDRSSQRTGEGTGRASLWFAVDAEFRS